MKNILLYSALCVACGGVHAQSASSVQTSTTSSAAQSGAVAIGGGQASSISQGGAGGNGGNGVGGAASSNVSVYLGGDPSGANAQPSANAQQVAGDPTTRIKEDIKTVGNPGAVSYGVSFSQFNCANTAAAGVGWLGGVFQLGGGLESAPCNDRANASALFQIAGALAQSNASLSSQLYHAAILLIGNSTRETQAALAQAGVADWQPATPVASAASVEADPMPVDYRH